MVNIIEHLFVGDDADEPKAVARGFYVLRCCKDGEFSHRALLGYTGKAAPEGKNYYFAERGKIAAMNLIDADDPAWIHDESIYPGLKFIRKAIDSGGDILVHCNAGHSRGPTTSLMYLRSVGEMTSGFMQSEKVFTTLYPKYDPASGMRQYARDHWHELLAVQESKHTKAEVHYENPAKMNHHCKDCSHFTSPDRCAIVAGLISPNGWCDQFNAA